MFLIGFRIISFDIFNRSEDSGWDSHGNEQSIPLRAVGKKKTTRKFFCIQLIRIRWHWGTKTSSSYMALEFLHMTKKTDWLTDWSCLSIISIRTSFEHQWTGGCDWRRLVALHPEEVSLFSSSSFDDLDTKCNHKTSSDLVWWLQTSFPPSPHICIPLDRQISPASARVSVHPHPYFRYSKCHRSYVFIGTMLPHPTPADSAQSTGKLVFSFFFKYW